VDTFLEEEPLNVDHRGIKIMASVDSTTIRFACPMFPVRCALGENSKKI